MARSQWRRVKWSEGDRTGVESGQIGVEESGEWPDRSGGEWNGVKVIGLEWRVAKVEWRRVEWNVVELQGLEWRVARSGWS